VVDGDSPPPVSLSHDHACCRRHADCVEARVGLYGISPGPYARLRVWVSLLSSEENVTCKSKSKVTLNLPGVVVVGLDVVSPNIINITPVTIVVTSRAYVC